MANIVPSCYRPRVRHLIAIGAALGAAVGCSRSGLDYLDSAPIAPHDQRADVDGSLKSGPEAVAPPTLGPDGSPPPTASAMEPSAPSEPDPRSEPPATREPGCIPRDEICNGKDDSCDGRVDEGIVPIPCAGGGEQYCVAGRYSACPTRCEVCIPGSERVCFHSYCTFWAKQICAADGRSFGVCREEQVPPECESVADRHKQSPELEQCCIDNGYCCRDEQDLDHDGDRNEMLGRCD